MSNDEHFLTAEQCRRDHGLTDAEIASLPARLGIRKGKGVSVYALGAVLALLDERRPIWCPSCGWALRSLVPDGAEYCFNDACGLNACDIWDDEEACTGKRPTLEPLPGECCGCGCITLGRRVHRSPHCVRDAVALCECHIDANDAVLAEAIQ